jgi:peptidyl-prolyl cis-trans isomerase B (cyclophilin B)
MKAFYSVAFLLLVLGLLLPQTVASQEAKKVDSKTLKATTPDSVAVLKIQHEGKDLGDIVIRLYPEIAPKHVANFKRLAARGDYDGTTFHRVIPGFMIQGGDMNSKNDDRNDDGYGSHPDGITLPAEFSDFPHSRGVVSMARGREPNSAGCQFFICVADSPHLDGQYSVFGEVIDGMDAADKIAAVKKDNKKNPLKKVTMTSVTIEPYKKMKEKDAKKSEPEEKKDE